MIIIHWNLYLLYIEREMQMHTLLFTHIYFTYECMYVGGCFLPLCSPLRSIPVCPVLGHSEHVFSVTLATTARYGYHMDFLNIGAITTRLIAHKMLVVADFCFGLFLLPGQGVQPRYSLSTWHLVSTKAEEVDIT